MVRSLLVLGICFVAVRCVVADEPPKYSPPVPPEQSAAQPVATVSPACASKPVAAISGRKKLESLLQTPADLNFEHKIVTVQEVLDGLHARHHLSIRMDVATLAGMFPTDGASNEEGKTPRDLVQKLLETKVAFDTVDFKTVSVATVLRHTLNMLPSGDLFDEQDGLPIALTNANLFDYVVEDDCLLITTRMKALTYKETRVYSVKDLKDFKPEQLAAVIRQSIRPWSWRSRIDELGEQLKAGGAQIPPQALGSIVKSGIQLASAETGITVSDAEDAKDKSDAKKEAEPSDAAQMAMVGNAVANGAVTLAHTALTALEIIHYADPPTGSIQTLPSKLIITQSQAAHREIAELLKQLSEE
jgi:hypothetical protein